MKTILLLGTADTKSDEMRYLRNCIMAQGAQVLVMDVGVLAQGDCPVDIDQHSVAAAADTQLTAIIQSGDENTAMMQMALGASRLSAQTIATGKAHGVLILGGSMGTDLALQVANDLPLGVPKVVLSTIAHSHLIPPERIPPDLIMVLWAGGLYGLSSVCRAALAQAAGAVVGAVLAQDFAKANEGANDGANKVANGQASGQASDAQRPLIGMTSLGKSCLSYMVRLKPALESRGFEVAVFHTTGMGGRAFEAMASQGKFAAVLDLSLQELANHVGGSVVTAGSTRLLGAGRAGVPQIVAPGAADMVDFAAWDDVPQSLAGRAVHVHNRLIASATSDAVLRQRIAAEMVTRLDQAQGPTALLMPLLGVQAWDKEGQPLHDPQGLEAFTHALQTEVQRVNSTRFTYQEVDAHINDEAFCDAVLAVFDDWHARGLIPSPRNALQKTQP